MNIRSSHATHFVWKLGLVLGGVYCRLRLDSQRVRRSGKNELEQRKLGDTVHLRIVRESYCVREQIPIMRMVRAVMSQRVKDSAVKSLDSSIALRVVSRREKVLHSDNEAHVLETLRGELFLLSERGETGGPYTNTQWCTNALATSIAVIFTSGTVRTSFEYCL